MSAHRERIDEVLPDVVKSGHPASLADPARFVLNGGGKRIRPIFLLLVAEAYGRSVRAALPAALAVEVFHNFTLVHDDIMDASDERRGRPTVHVKWDVGTAILVGDLLMGRSYELLGEVDDTPLEALYEVYHPMVKQLCSGQALDASFEDEPVVSVEAYLDMIDGKTAALLSAAFELGAVVGEAPRAHRERLRAAGIETPLLKIIGIDGLTRLVRNGRSFGTMLDRYLTHRIERGRSHAAAVAALEAR